MGEKVVNLKADGDYRIIAISDIHGHVSHFANLIKRINLTDDDYLVVIGDFINKGENSYQTLKCLKDLGKRKRTFVLKGNHEYSMEIFTGSKERFHQIYDYLKGDHLETLLDGLLEDAELSIDDFKDSDDFFAFVNKEYRHVVDYIRSLPIILYLDDFRFVHGGFDSELCTQKDEHKFLKFDNYNSLSKINEITTVVGHWPACMLREDKLSNMPYFNHEKKIISIDGGMGVKNAPELNALIIEKKDGVISYECVQENDFEMKKIVKSHQFLDEEIIHIKYPSYEFEVIESDDLMSLCKHKDTNQEFSIFNSLIMENGEALVPKIDYINKFFNLEVGDDVLVCDTYDECVLIKRDDEFGWVLREQIG
ncbi:metallophosphoesterase [Acidaminobacter sp. JC074]|uniref:metallophosphoesterase n=1 Tax=Acidaminobacter sp. JC074 TaxID=2530199 RepID=UPI001F10C8B0|nr:metallophosphoesterase [Acidaminobacter sp. JC074]